MNKRLERVQLLIGNQGINTLANSTVLVVGVGGVGAMAIEALARSGVGHLIIVDGDNIGESNINRQIHATTQTIGQPKVEAMKERVFLINPDCQVSTYQVFFDMSQKEILNSKIDFVIDAIDTITSKIDLIEICLDQKIPFISSMGMANRFDSSKLIVTTLDKTEYDPFSKAVRAVARKRNLNLKQIPVVFSQEVGQIQNQTINESGTTRKERTPPASTSFVPPAAGLLLASYVVRKLLEVE